MFPKILLFIGISIAFGNSLLKDAIYSKDFYKSGVLKSEGWMENGQKQGYWKFYHSNGKISAEGHYKNGQREKYWYFYSDQRVRTKEGHYKSGKKNNWWLFYDKKGRIHHKCQLANGKKNGYCLKYTDAELTSAEKYKNGQKVKEWFSFSSFRRENKLSDLR
ncbi:MAG: hypothetical protein AAFX53_03845 [Bacteroidota bacterium]